MGVTTLGELWVTTLTVAAVDINCIVATHTVPNAFNTEDFNFALENFIAPGIGKFVLNEPGSFVEMDNCRIHDSDVTINIIYQKGGLAVFLPYRYTKFIYLMCSCLREAKLFVEPV